MSWIELELHRMRAAPADLSSSDSRVHLASPGPSPSEIVDLAEDVSGEPVALSSANLYLETLPQPPSEIVVLGSWVLDLLLCKVAVDVCCERSLCLLNFVYNESISTLGLCDSAVIQPLCSAAVRTCCC